MTGTVISAENVGKWFRRERVRRKMTMDEVAEKTGLSKSTIVRLETTSHTPAMFTVEQVVKLFGNKLVILDGGTGTDGE